MPKLVKDEDINLMNSQLALATLQLFFLYTKNRIRTVHMIECDELGIYQVPRDY